jgi:hypothetical protein
MVDPPNPLERQSVMPPSSVAARSLALAVIGVGAASFAAQGQNVTAFNPYSGAGLAGGPLPQYAAPTAAPADSVGPGPVAGPAFNPWSARNPVQASRQVAPPQASAPAVQAKAGASLPPPAARTDQEPRGCRSRTDDEPQQVARCPEGEHRLHRAGRQASSHASRTPGGRHAGSSAGSAADARGNASRTAAADRNRPCVAVDLFGAGHCVHGPTRRNPASRSRAAHCASALATTSRGRTAADGGPRAAAFAAARSAGA